MVSRSVLERYDSSSIAALSDGIFGVAMTLLVLDVHLLGPSVEYLAAHPCRYGRDYSASASRFSSSRSTGSRTIVSSRTSSPMIASCF